MKPFSQGILVVPGTLFSGILMAGEPTDLTQLKSELEQLKSNYESRIEALESQPKDEPSPAATITSGNAFNPAISVILDGNYYGDDANGAGDEILGGVDGISHSHNAHEDEHGDEDAHNHGSTEECFNLREAEIAISATVDHYFDATTYFAVTSDGSIEVEEAWLQTRSLPAGLRVKAGKLFSGIGYTNDKHPHSWGFADQNLVYRNLLGDHGLQDTGVQLTWLPELPVYLQLGVETLQGSQEKLGALVEDGEALEAKDSGPRLFTLFSKFSPSIGYDHELQLGAWLAHSTQHQEQHGEVEDEHEAEDTPEGEDHTPLHTLQGDARMFGFDAVYTYDSNAAHGQGDLKLQAEYLRQEKDLEIAYHADNAAVVGAERKFKEDGFYLQGTYGIAPRWQLGLRYDSIGSGVNKLESAGQTLKKWDGSDRWTLATTWNPTEFSRLRLQYSTADLAVDGVQQNVDAWYLQWNVSLGQHGAHKF